MEITDIETALVKPAGISVTKKSLRTQIVWFSTQIVWKRLCMGGVTVTHA